jgi:DNA repair exonuclease SbcCD nuclease subunit
MSRIIFTADWHIHPWRECSQDAGADRLADGLYCVRQILAEAQRRNCPVVFGGDMKQIKGQWPVPVLNGIIELLHEHHDVDVFAISGNHDGIVDGRSGLAALNELPNFHLFDVPTVRAAPWDGAEQVAYWPWQPMLDGLPAFLQRAKRAKARVLVAHAFLSGASVGPDFVRVSKAEGTLEQFGLAGKGRVFQLGLFGDIHKRQKLGASTQAATVWYAGSPSGQNWGERELDKGALLVDLDAETIEPILITAPRFRVVDATTLTAKALEGMLYRGHSTEFAGDWTGDFVRMLVGPRVDGEVLERIREASKARAFQVVIQREARTERRAEVHAAMSHGELLEKYVKARPPEDGLSAKAVLEAGRRLLG